MNIEQKNDNEELSALDKIRLLKEEKAQKEAEKVKQNQEAEQKKSESLDQEIVSTDNTINETQEAQKELAIQLQDLDMQIEEKFEIIRGAVSESQEAGILEDLDANDRSDVFGNDSVELTKLQKLRVSVSDTIDTNEKLISDLTSKKQELFYQTPEGQQQKKQEQAQEIRDDLASVGVKIQSFRFKDVESLGQEIQAPNLGTKVLEVCEKDGRDAVKEVIVEQYMINATDAFENQKKTPLEVQEQIKSLSPEQVQATRKKYDEFKIAQQEFRKALQDKAQEFKQKGLEFNSEYASGYGTTYERFITLTEYDGPSDRNGQQEELLLGALHYSGAFPPKIDFSETEKLLASRVDSIKEYTQAIKSLENTDDVYNMNSPKGATNKAHNSAMDYRQLPTFFLQVKGEQKTGEELIKSLGIEGTSVLDVQRKLSEKIQDIQDQENIVRELSEIEIEKALHNAETLDTFEDLRYDDLQKQKEGFERGKVKATNARMEATKLNAQYHGNLNDTLGFHERSGLEFKGMFDNIEQKRKERDDTISQLEETIKSKKSEWGIESKKNPWTGKGKEKHKKMLSDLKTEYEKLEEDLRNKKSEKIPDSNDANPKIFSYFEALGDYSGDRALQEEFIERNRDKINEGITLSELFDIMKQEAQEKMDKEFPSEKQAALDKTEDLQKKKDELLLQLAKSKPKK